VGLAVAIALKCSQ